jgi:hypothetical protein
MVMALSGALTVLVGISTLLPPPQPRTQITVAVPTRVTKRMRTLPGKSIKAAGNRTGGEEKAPLPLTTSVVQA